MSQMWQIFKQPHFLNYFYNFDEIQLMWSLFLTLVKTFYAASESVSQHLS